MDHPAQLRLEGQVIAADCNIFDLSLRGIQLATKARLGKDCFVRFCVILHPEFEINIEAWVAWQKPAGRHTVYGLYFHRIKDADKDKIYKFLCRFFPERVRRQMRDGSGTEEPAAKEEKMQDRRIFERFPARLPMLFLNAGAGLDGEAEALDISGKGIGFVSGRAMPAGTELEVWLKASAGAEPVYARGTVAWSRQAGAGIFRQGINLEKANLVGLSQALQTR